jgi:hypothetical protein
MKLQPGDLIIDKNLNRTLTILSVETKPYMSIGDYKVEYDLIRYMDSKEQQGKVKQVWQYELDVWQGLELLRANKI